MRCTEAAVCSGGTHTRERCDRKLRLGIVRLAQRDLREQLHVRAKHLSPRIDLPKREDRRNTHTRRTVTVVMVVGRRAGDCWQLVTLCDSSAAAARDCHESPTVPTVGHAEMGSAWGGVGWGGVGCGRSLATRTHLRLAGTHVCTSHCRATADCPSQDRRPHICGAAAQPFRCRTERHPVSAAVFIHPKGSAHSLCQNVQHAKVASRARATCAHGCSLAAKSRPALRSEPDRPDSNPYPIVWPPAELGRERGVAHECLERRSMVGVWRGLLARIGAGDQLH